jgi:hypothetical protein
MPVPILSAPAIAPFCGLVSLLRSQYRNLAVDDYLGASHANRRVFAQFGLTEKTQL